MAHTETASNLAYENAVKQRRNLRKLWIAFLLFPAIAILLTFVFLPMASAVWYSVYDWDGLVRGEFIGLANFQEVLFNPRNNKFLINAFLNNVKVFIALMIVQNGLALILALFLAREPKGYRFYQIAFFSAGDFVDCDHWLPVEIVPQPDLWLGEYLAAPSGLGRLGDALVGHARNRVGRNDFGECLALGGFSNPCFPRCNSPHSKGSDRGSAS